MDGAVRLALRRAPELGAARQRIAAARARKKQARAAYWPHAGLQASYIARWPKNELPIDLSGLSAVMPGAELEIAEIDDVHHFRAGLQLGFRALDLSRGPRVDAAEHARGAAAEGAREVAAAVAFRARATFLAALLARDLARIAADSLVLARAHLARQSSATRVGTGSELALAQARVRVAELEASQAHARGERRRHLGNLAALLKLEGPLQLEGDLERLARRSAPRADDAGPTVRRLRRARAAARSLQTSASRGFWPTLSLMGKAEVEYPHAMRLEWGPLLTAGAALEWRLFDGFSRSGEVDRQAAEVRGLRHQERAAAESRDRRLRDLEARRATARSRLASAREVLRQSELQLRIARSSASAGAATHLDRRAAEVSMDGARVGVSRALMELCLINAEAMRALGLDQGRGMGGN